jgi:hypothetical protein
MNTLKNFDKWNSIKEARKPRKCPILDFGPLRESTVYKDLISLGWVEVNAQGVERIDPALELGKTELKYQVQFQGEKQGNLRFKHERYANSIRVNMNGRVWEDAPSGKAYEITLSYDYDSKWTKACLTVDEYKDRLEYLIKKLLYDDGFINRNELVNAEGGVEIIKRKLDEDPTSVKKLRTVPPSLQQDQGYLKTVDEYGFFED